MKKSYSALLVILLVAGQAYAQAPVAPPPAPTTFQLNTVVPTAPRGDVITGFSVTPALSANPAAGTTVVITPAPSASGPPSVAAAGPSTSNVPAGGPAQGPANKVVQLSATPSVASPAVLVPGVPTKTYPTLSAAAKDGVDPLTEKKVSSELPKIANEAGATPAGFDPTSPVAYVDWVKTGDNWKFALAGLLAFLLAGGALWRARA